MPPKHEFTVRLTGAQYRVLERLAEKLSLDKASTIRFALARLAQNEGLLGEIPK